MFRAIYKNTWKTLFRSVTLWLAVLVLLGISAFYIYDCVSGYWAATEFVHKIEPDYVYDVMPEELLQEIHNAVCRFLYYPIAFFGIIATALVLNRDYGDQFFEIEKAAGVSPFRYIAGRLTAVLTVSEIVLEVVSSVSLYAVLIGKGGVAGQNAFQTMLTTLPRLTRGVLFTGIPHLCFYIGLTYLFGTLFRNGPVGGAMGFLQVILYRALYTLYWLDESWKPYFQYFSPSPLVLRSYVAYVGTANEEAIFTREGVTVGGMVFCVVFLVGIGLLCAAVSYWRTRRREI